MVTGQKPRHTRDETFLSDHCCIDSVITVCFREALVYGQVFEISYTVQFLPTLFAPCGRPGIRVMYKFNMYLLQNRLSWHVLYTRRERIRIGHYLSYHTPSIHPSLGGRIRQVIGHIPWETSGNLFFDSSFVIVFSSFQQEVVGFCLIKNKKTTNSNFGVCLCCLLGGLCGTVLYKYWCSRVFAKKASVSQIFDEESSNISPGG